MRSGALLLTGIVLAFCESLHSAETITEVTTLANERIVGPIRSWEPSRLIIESNPPREIPTAEILSLRFPRHQRRATLGPCVVLVNGDRFAAAAIQSRDEELTATWTNAPLRPELTLPLETVSAVVFTSSPGRTEWLETLGALSKIRAGADLVRLIAGDQLAGEFQRLDGGLLEFSAAVGPLKLERNRVQWLALDPDLGSPLPMPSSGWTAFLTDGSRITATDCQPRADFTVQLTSLVGGRVVVPWHELIRLQPITPRIAPLSRRRALSDDYEPYLDGRQAATRNRCVTGSPLTIRGEEFATGLGVRSGMTTTYEIGPKDGWFRSTVGIDDAAAGDGSVRFRIELDGRGVWSSPLLTGRSDAVETPLIDLSAAKRLTLIVEFGERGDVGDLADWCDPLIIAR